MQLLFRFYFLIVLSQCCQAQLLIQTQIESVVVRGAIGSSNDCGEWKEFGFVANYEVTPCVSKANATCPLQVVRANEIEPMYTTTIHYGPSVTFDFWSERWGLWLVTDAARNTATISLKKESKNDNKVDWCTGKPKWCFWRNYTITSCPKGSPVIGTSNQDLIPIASITVSPDDMNNFPTMDAFDVFLQPNCPVRCGVAGLGCCADGGPSYDIDRS